MTESDIRDQVLKRGKSDGWKSMDGGSFRAHLIESLKKCEFCGHSLKLWERKGFGNSCYHCFKSACKEAQEASSEVDERIYPDMDY